MAMRGQRDSTLCRVALVGAGPGAGSLHGQLGAALAMQFATEETVVACVKQ